MADPVINPELAKLLPAHSKEELEQLEANIKADGKIIDWILYATIDGVDTIIDGMTRWSFVQKDSTIVHSFKFVENVTTMAEARLWVLEHQLGRRNLLKPHEIRKLRGTYYNELKAANNRADNLLSGGEQRQNATSGCTPKSGGRKHDGKDSADVVAKVACVDRATVIRSGKYAAAFAKIPEQLQRQIEAGTAKTSEQAVIRLAECAPEVKEAVFKDLRHGGYKSSLQDVMAKRGLLKKSPPKPKDDHPAPEAKPAAKTPAAEPPPPPVEEPKAAQPPKNGSVKEGVREIVDRLFRLHVGPISRGIEDIGKIRGTTPAYHKAYDNMNRVIEALKEIKRAAQ